METLTNAIGQGYEPSQPEHKEGALHLAQVVDWDRKHHAHQNCHEALLYHLHRSTARAVTATIARVSSAGVILHQQ